MKRLITIGAFLSGFMVAPFAMAFDTTTDFVVRSLYASKRVTSSSVSDNKVVQEARNDAATFVASNGEVLGVHLEAVLKYMRSQGALSTANVSDLELAKAILAKTQ